MLNTSALAENPSKHKINIVETPKYAPIVKNIYLLVVLLFTINYVVLFLKFDLTHGYIYIVGWRKRSSV